MKYIYLATIGPSDNQIEAFETPIGAVAHLLDKSSDGLKVVLPDQNVRTIANMVEANYNHADDMSKWLERCGFLQFNMLNTRALKVPYHPIDSLALDEIDS